MAEESKMTDLEMASTADLIHELVKRTTFAGLLIYDQKPLRKNTWSDSGNIRVLARNIKGRQAIQLLDRASKAIQGNLR